MTLYDPDVEALLGPHDDHTNCRTCAGKGDIECATCKGSGEIKHSHWVQPTPGHWHRETTVSGCRECNGSGRRMCGKCSGTGKAHHIVLPALDTEEFRWLHGDDKHGLHVRADYGHHGTAYVATWQPSEFYARQERYETRARAHLRHRLNREYDLNTD